GTACACGTATSRPCSISSTLWTACARRARPPSIFCVPSPRLLRRLTIRELGSLDHSGPFLAASPLNQWSCSRPASTQT
ncbi:hypothetical protein LPJ61_005574, partial [Coemansia biformis]